MRRVVAALLFFVATAAADAVRAVTLVRVAGDLSSPLFVTHSGDGSSTLYVVERAGIVKRLDPGRSPTVFLDLSASVLAGNERGLLGLAFHPDYVHNGRLFVYYTRRPDGAIVVAEHRRLTGDSARADANGSIVVSIPHPLSNHNGGMLAFGPDRYLYIGTGDGGGANDPGNQAQNVESLLGKILRVDIDRSGAGTPYAIPADNPFVTASGRNEIFATGLRNPWRFSFDRATGALWVADVGQGAREEVNAPLVRGGNYGWRVYEGSVCTHNDALLCDPARYLPPRFEYAHGGGRCSITGGYVYRGSAGALPPGTYVYADFCTGEIFGFDGSAQALLADTPMSIASFGEDADGELYVVDLGGAVHRLAADAPSNGAVAIEYFHAGFGHYFTTSLAGEIAMLDGGAFEGWARTGEAFRVEAPGTPGQADVCRFFSGNAFVPKSSHFYTPHASECEAVTRDPHWNLEGVPYALSLPDAAGACAFGATPLYRLYNGGQGGAPNHRYTTRFATRAAMLRQGWIAEGLGADGVIACVPG